MIAWLAARCDPPEYGKLIVYLPGAGRARPHACKCHGASASLRLACDGLVVRPGQGAREKPGDEIEAD
jgi:hypothetical protein